MEFIRFTKQLIYNPKKGNALLHNFNYEFFSIEQITDSCLNFRISFRYNIYLKGISLQFQSIYN